MISLPFHALPPWSFSAVYQPGDEVRYYDGYRYRAVMVNVGCRPSGPRTGLAGSHAKTTIRPWVPLESL